MKDLSGSGDVNCFATKLKKNLNFDFLIASTFINKFVAKKNIVNSDNSWKNITKKNISNFLKFNLTLF